MRVAAYAGASTVLAAGVILRAFHERPNFYSATVYLGQSNASRMILLNMLLLSAGSLVFGLQRLLYGPLRPIEIEQLWDKAWYALTETALAMTTFRDEVGGWFFVMFMTLLAGKVWVWIGEGRVDILEQQPPANPRLFHTRLIASLLVSEAFDILMLRYSVRTLLEQPRPGMMVMFAFEFAVLAIASSSTTARYALSLHESLVVKRQTKAKLDERRAEVQAGRQEAQAPAISDGAGETAALSSNNRRVGEIDEDDIDVPGWQEKGRWILFLDLATDFLKLLVYLSFFMILLAFHGIPIHIIRDVFITGRSFVKRINDFIKYRNATRDMNARYPDATAEDLARDGTCIICREEMRPWHEPNLAPAPAGAGPRPARTPTDERQRPKKLPCGHILHFGCLRSWLERQQACPTCRRPVLSSTGDSRVSANQNRPDPANRQVIAPLGDNQQGAQEPNQNRPANGQNGGMRARTFGLGSWRVTFAAGTSEQVRNALREGRFQNTAEGARLVDALGRIQPQGNNEGGGSAFQDQIAGIERHIMQEINRLNAAQEQLTSVRALQGELARLRIAQSNSTAAQPGQQAPLPPVVQHNFWMGIPPGATLGTVPVNINGVQQVPIQWRVPPFAPALAQQQYQLHSAPPHLQQQVFGARSHQPTLNAGHPDLPAGLTLPEGWALLPLHRTGSTIGQSLAEQQSDDMTILLQVQLPGPEMNEAENTPNRGPTPTTNVTNTQAQPPSDDFSAPVTHFNRISNGVTHTSAPAQDIPSAAQPQTALNLPDWSNSAPGPSTRSPVPAASQPEHSESNPSRSPSVGQNLLPQESSSPTPHATENGHAFEGKGKGKGKARAATVENDVD